MTALSQNSAPSSTERLAVEPIADRPRRQPLRAVEPEPPPAPAEPPIPVEPPPPPAVYGSDVRGVSPAFSGFGAPLHPFVQGLLDTLPPPDTAWTEDERAKWLRAAATIFDLIYKGDARITVRAGEASEPVTGGLAKALAL